MVVILQEKSCTGKKCQEIIVHPKQVVVFSGRSRDH